MFLFEIQCLFEIIVGELIRIEARRLAGSAMSQWYVYIYIYTYMYIIYFSVIVIVIVLVIGRPDGRGPRSNAG